MSKSRCDHCGARWGMGWVQWKNVKEDLPKGAGHYLGCADWSGVIEKVEFDGKNQWNSAFGVTHWMPLPKPPEERGV